MYIDDTQISNLIWYIRDFIFLHLRTVMDILFYI